MIYQLHTYFRISLALGIFCAVILSPVAAQDFSGPRGDMSASQQIKLKYFAKLPVHILFTDASFGESRISYQNKDGDLRSYQHPESAHEYSLTSYGLTSYKDVRLEGRFQYRKEFEKDIGWKLVRDAYHQPHYYGNIRPGDWDNDRYELKLSGGTTFFDDRLLLGLGVDYQLEQLARYNDPRPEISYYNLFLKSQLGWRIGNHRLALYFGTGDTEEKGAVSNYDEANDSFGRQEYNIITVSGVGTYNLRERNRYEEMANRNEIGLSYQFKQECWQLNAEAIAGRTDRIFNFAEINNGNIIEGPIGKYYQEYFDGRVFFSIPRSQYTIQILSKTHWSDGYDEHARFSGTNYFDKQWQQELRFFYYNANQSIALQAGLLFNAQSFTDRNASHDYQYQRLRPDLSLQYSTSWGSRSVSFIPGISYNTSVSKNISVSPTSRNMLTKYLVSPDYYLHTSDILGLRGGFQIKQNFENLAVALLVDYRRQMVINEGTVFGQPKFMPGNNRNTLTLTLQFFH